MVDLTAEVYNFVFLNITHNANRAPQLSSCSQLQQAQSYRNRTAVAATAAPGRQGRARYFSFLMCGELGVLGGVACCQLKKRADGARAFSVVLCLYCGLVAPKMQTHTPPASGYSPVVYVVCCRLLLARSKPAWSNPSGHLDQNYICVYWRICTVFI